MGERKESRVKMVLPVRVYGTNSEGKPYSILAHTLDFSRSGARLGGIVRQLQVGETVTLDFKNRRAQFAVRWMGVPGTRSEQQAGVQALQPEKLLWLEVPPEGYTDDVELARRRSTQTEPREAVLDRPQEVTDCAPTTVNTTAIENSADDVAPGQVEEEPPTRTLVESLLSIVDRVGDGQPVEASENDKPVRVNGSGGEHTPDSAISAIEDRIAAEAGSLDGALDLIAAGAQRLLNGTGAAIALPDNNEMVCRASAGRAPRVGVRFRADAGLTAEAVSGNRIVTCNNTLSDPRVDAEVWRKIGIRSAISAPIVLSQGATAVLEVFAPDANAFDAAHVRVVEALATLVHRIVARSSQLEARAAPPDPTP